MNLLGIEGDIYGCLEKEIVRTALIGCGSHAYRNILSALRFVPRARLIATCDTNNEKSRLYAEAFGAETYYSSIDEMLKSQTIDAVLLIVGFDPLTGDPLYPDLACKILEHGIPVWMEKPPAASSHQVQRMINSAEIGGTFFQVGFKMMFAPAIIKTYELLQRSEIGSPHSFDISYAVPFPREPSDLNDPSARRFIDDIVHVLSQIQYLFGTPTEMAYFRGKGTDASAILLYPDGLHGVIRILGAASIIGPAEQLRISGGGADDGWIIQVNHGKELILHERGNPGSYGRDVSFIRPDDTHTHVWSPDLRSPLGALSLHSEALFGYVGELSEFADSVAERRPPSRAGHIDALSVMMMYDMFSMPERSVHQVKVSMSGQNAVPRKSREATVCPYCYGKMHLKDGWCLSCAKCGATKQL